MQPQQQGQQKTTTQLYKIDFKQTANFICLQQEKKENKKYKMSTKATTNRIQKPPKEKYKL